MELLGALIATVIVTFYNLCGPEGTQYEISEKPSSINAGHSGVVYDHSPEIPCCIEQPGEIQPSIPLQDSTFNR